MSRTFEGCNRRPVWRVANESAESRHAHRGSVALLQLALRQVEERGGVDIVAMVGMENDPESRESDNTRLQNGMSRTVSYQDACRESSCV